MLIITEVYVMAVNVTKMNAEDDQSGACLKDPGEMSGHRISLLTAMAITTTTMSCINSKDFIIPRHSHQSNYSLRWNPVSRGVHANMNFSFILGVEFGFTCWPD